MKKRGTPAVLVAGVAMRRVLAVLAAGVLAAGLAGCTNSNLKANTYKDPVAPAIQTPNTNPSMIQPTQVQPFNGPQPAPIMVPP
jgi:ABC-type uncharacterized transport system auxiliary subunit